MDKKNAFVLGVDLDAVVGDYEEAFRQFVAADAGLDPALLIPPATWSMVSPGWPIRDEEHYAELHARAVREARLFANMPEMPGASEALWTLSDADVWIRIVTHRLFTNGGHRNAASDTVEWLEYGPPSATQPLAHRSFIPYRDLCFISDKPEVGAHLYIDDAPHNILALRAAGASVLAFDQRYNRDIDGPRVRDWAEAVDVVLAAKAAHDRALG